MLDFSISAEQKALVESVRRLMAAHAKEDYVQQLDQNHEYPYELYQRWVEADLLSLAFPVELGGGGGSVVDMVLVAEELGRCGYDLVGVYGTPVFNALNIAMHGTQELRDTYLPPFFKGNVRFCVSITEPDAGSDAGAIRTSAVLDGDKLIVNGQKMFTSGALADDSKIMLYCRTRPDGPATTSLSCLLVDATAPGVTIRPVDTLGRNMLQTTHITLDNVEVSLNRVVGALHDGWSVLISGLQFERITTAAAYVGNAQTVVDQALGYAKQREQFGQPIAEFQVISHQLADMQTEVDAARLLTYRAAWKMDAEGDAVREVSMAKLYGSEAFRRAALAGVQIMGGYGYCSEMSMQRHLRAAVGATITAGTSQMQRQTIARTMGIKVRR